MPFFTSLMIGAYLIEGLKSFIYGLVYVDLPQASLKCWQLFCSNRKPGQNRCCWEIESASHRQTNIWSVFFSWVSLHFQTYTCSQVYGRIPVSTTGSEAWRLYHRNPIIHRTPRFQIICVATIRSFYQRLQLAMDWFLEITCLFTIMIRVERGLQNQGEILQYSMTATAHQSAPRNRDSAKLTGYSRKSANTWKKKKKQGYSHVFSSILWMPGLPQHSHFEGGLQEPGVGLSKTQCRKIRYKKYYQKKKKKENKRTNFCIPVFLNCKPKASFQNSPPWTSFIF